MHRAPANLMKTGVNEMVDGKVREVTESFNTALAATAPGAKGYGCRK